MKLYIKNMVCDRCKMIVRKELEELGLHVESVELGEVIVSETIDRNRKEKIKGVVEPLGFVLLEDKKSELIELIKVKVIELVHYETEELKVNLSDYLSEQLHHDYSYLSNLFSEVESSTIEKFYIAQKIEKVKELLVYDELSLTEIAFKLNYSSVAHLSNQFKKVTGLTPSYFKNMKSNKRQSLDKL